ncbi:MAG: family 10 glycosylhydrolase [Oscillospiraceae bacterium]|nr:family 10 glycosylhydrolase [Oscillospiraceae bacterium]
MRQWFKNPARLALVLLVLLFIGSCGTSAGTGTKTPQTEQELKAVWVATVYRLDYPSQATTNAAVLQQEADEILQNCAALGMNAVFLQVRPSADALYPSTLFPWSRYLTGSQTAAPSGGFDPLAYWVDRAHALGLELHAWINPYRITRGGQAEFDTLAPSSPAKLHPDWVIQHEGNFYFDPSLPQVQELVIQGAEELCRNYAIDGIHLDDYFYPGTDFDDSASFAARGSGFSSLGDWRRDNVNQLVQALGTRIHAINPDLSYGISPSGVWADKRSLSQGSNTTGGFESYYASYADSRKWVLEGWIDYICPQIYWYIGHNRMDYETIARWWADTVRGTGVKLYVGMADYMISDDPASPWHGTAALEAQLALNDTLPEVAGAAHFRYQFLVGNPALRALYESRAGQSGTAVPPPPLPAERPRALRLNTWSSEGYIQGSNGKFRPDASLTRGEAVALLARLTVDEAGNPLYTGASGENLFSDVSSDAWYTPYISFAQWAGIAQGYLDGTFRPEQPVSRAELVQLLWSYTEDPAVQNSQPFPDVSLRHWAASSIAYAAEQGWVSGYLDGTFRPDQPVSRAEAVKLINAALGRQSTPTLSISPFSDLPTNHWAYQEICAAAGFCRIGQP